MPIKAFSFPFPLLRDLPQVAVDVSDYAETAKCENCGGSTMRPRAWFGTLEYPKIKTCTCRKATSTRIELSEHDGRRQI